MMMLIGANSSRYWSDAKHVVPEPISAASETDPAENAGIDEKEQEGLVIMQAQTGGKPGTVVVHFEDTALAGAAMVRAVRFGGVALFAEARRAARGDGDGLDGGRGGVRKSGRAIGFVVEVGLGSRQDGVFAFVL